MLIYITAGEGEDGIYLLASADATTVAPTPEVAKAVGAALGGRGGGARGRYQGKGTRMSMVDDARAAAEAVLAAVAQQE